MRYVWTLCAALAFSSTAANSPLQFADVTATSGIEFQHTSAPSARFDLTEIMGSGGALFDFDNDADLDLFLVNTAPGGSRFYEQISPRKFVPREIGLSNPGRGMGATIGDVDNDGDLDLYVTNVGADFLFRNDGIRFTNISEPALSGSSWSTSAAFCDIDNDGFLDLYVATYVEPDPRQRCTTRAGAPDYCPPSAFASLPDRLLRNNGDGTFADISRESGIGTRPNPALGVVCMDVNGDHMTDFVVANDGEPNRLWINQGRTQFEDGALVYGVATNLFGKAEASMGIALGDVNDDGAMDLFMTHIDQETNTLYTSDTSVFQDATIRSKLGPASVPFTGFGTVLFDADHDADLDLAIANGRVRITRPGTSPNFLALYGETNQVFENRGHGEFAESCGIFCERSDVSRGLLAGDLDADGDLDLIVTNSNGPARVFANTGSNGGWAKVRAIENNRDAIGAVVQIRSGDNASSRIVTHASGYLTATEASVHFGLGAADHIDSIEVTWPDGLREHFPGAAGNRVIVLRKGSGNQ